MQWKVFQADRTVLFDKIINSMGSQIEQQQDNNGCLAYWLSNTVTLLYLLQRNIKPASGGSYNSRLRASPTQRWAGDAPSCALVHRVAFDSHDSARVKAAIHIIAEDC